MPDFKKRVFNKFSGRCAYCGNEITLSNMTIDHVRPRSKGGSMGFFNCFPSCQRCNGIKADGTVEEMRQKLISSLQKIKTDRNFQMIRKYKMVTLVSEDVRFYFEDNEETKEELCD